MRAGGGAPGRDPPRGGGVVGEVVGLLGEGDGVAAGLAEARELDRIAAVDARGEDQRPAETALDAPLFGAGDLRIGPALGRGGEAELAEGDAAGLDAVGNAALEIGEKPVLVARRLEDAAPGG